MKQPDAITERDNLRRENAELKRIIAETQDLAADRLSRISALEESLSQAQGERAHAAIRVADAAVIFLYAEFEGGIERHRARSQALADATREYRALTEPSIETRLEAACDNLDARAAVIAGVYREGGEVEC